MVDPPKAERRPAFYAAGPGGWRDWWTLLHPPYTAWHLSYVVIGACLAPHVNLNRLVYTLVAFLLAVGFGAHALDELHGRPLGTRIPTPILIGVTVVSLSGAVALGIVGVVRVGWPLVPFMVLGPLLVVAYNWELFGGIVHTDAGFALAWGSFPVLVAYVAQTGRLALSPVLAAVAAFALSAAQRRLSTPARLLRRRASRVEGRITLSNGEQIPLDERTLLAPLETTLHAMSWGVMLRRSLVRRGPAGVARTDRTSAQRCNSLRQWCHRSTGRTVTRSPRQHPCGTSTSPEKAGDGIQLSTDVDRGDQSRRSRLSALA